MPPQSKLMLTVPMLAFVTLRLESIISNVAMPIDDQACRDLLLARKGMVAGWISKSEAFNLNEETGVVTVVTEVDVPDVGVGGGGGADS
jgi:hypothetical protein